MRSTNAEALLAELNPPQREAVTHVDGPLLVLAGAGSGKTRVITHRIAHLLAAGMPPESILAITFTNKAAGEMRERTERLCGLRSHWITTFHSLAARLLRRHIYRLEPYDTSFTICDRDDCRAIIKEILETQGVDPHLWNPAGVVAEISRIKGTLEGDDSALGSDYCRGVILRNVYLRYIDVLRERNLLDFDDLLLLLVRLFREHGDVLERYREQFRYVLIDEYQDTNTVQYRITNLLAQAHRNLCITGDPDQSIYRWRGADIGNILNFERDYPGARVVKLEENYRSAGNILAAANALISRNAERKPKELWTTKPDGEPVRVYRFDTEVSEAREIAGLILRLADSGRAYGDVAVFYRIHSLSRAIEQELILANVPYSIVGGIEFFLRKEVKDVLAYLRILDNPRDSESLKRIINVPPRGIGKGTVARLEEVARSHRRGLLHVLLHEDFDPEFTPRQRRVFAGFRSLYSDLSRLQGGSMEELVSGVIRLTGYGAHLESSSGEEAEERLANLGELVGAAAEYDRTHAGGALTGFLELAAMLGDVDRWEPSKDRVSLMALHSSKGLEFPVTIILGVEDGILPLVRAGDDSTDIEEERRLFYVGITRAMEMLYITHTRARARFGQRMRSAPSRFLRELVPEGTAPMSSLRQLEMDAETEASLYGPPAMSRSVQDDIELDDPGSDGFEIDEDPYPPGTRVVHDEYGEGEILRASGLGARRRITVRFDEAGEKQFVASYAPLRRVR